MDKEYLGDGVYLQIEDDILKLTTENGYSATNTIYLEPDIYDRLKRVARHYGVDTTEERTT